MKCLEWTGKTKKIEDMQPSVLHYVHLKVSSVVSWPVYGANSTIYETKRVM